MTLKLDTKMSPPPIEIPRPINWARAVENDDVCGFAQEMSLLVSPFIYTIHQSVSGLQWEITCISKGIIDAATKYLPRKKAKKKKSVIKDNELKALCRASRTTWLKWQDAGRPSHSKLAEEKKSTKKQVRQFVASARARLVRSEIQEIACLRRTTPYVSRPQT